jgi:hypothetical protein
LGARARADQSLEVVDELVQLNSKIRMARQERGAIRRFPGFGRLQVLRQQLIQLPLFIRG